MREHATAVVLGDDRLDGIGHRAQRLGLAEGSRPAAVERDAVVARADRIASSTMALATRSPAPAIEDEVSRQTMIGPASSRACSVTRLESEIASTGTRTSNSMDSRSERARSARSDKRAANMRRTRRICRSVPDLRRHCASSEAMTRSSAAAR